MENERTLDQSKVEGLIGAIVDYSAANGVNYLEIAQACRSMYYGAAKMMGGNLADILRVIEEGGEQARPAEAID